MQEHLSLGANSGADIVRGAHTVEALKAPRFRYEVECVGPDGSVKWRDIFENLVTDVGRDDVLDKYFKGASYTAAWFVGLIDADGFTTGVDAGDTAASHGGWAESTEYSNATRPALTLGAVATQSVDNSASKAAFNINAATTIKGCFVTTLNTKGGTTGILYSAGLFSGGDKIVADQDTLNVTVTLTS
jgi:hypothetical protein